MSDSKVNKRKMSDEVTDNPNNEKNDTSSIAVRKESLLSEIVPRSH